MPQSADIFWFRRDLRLKDNAGLYHALRSGRPVVPVFVFDRNILDQLEDKNDRRVEFIREELTKMQQTLAGFGSSLEIYYGTPKEMFKTLLKNYDIQHVFCNHDYEPYARERDDDIRKLLQEAGASFHSYKDQVIFEKDEVMKDNNEPYTVFTPYSKKWKAKLSDFYLKAYPSLKCASNFYRRNPIPVPSLASMKFEPVGMPFPSEHFPKDIISKYNRQRDYPGIQGTSKMGVHLRFGTVSIRQLAAQAVKLNEVYLNELIWRDFYHAILWHFPRVGKGRAFKTEYEFIKWRNNEKEFGHWCNGATGYPLVDAGMRELNTTGFMHNRVRMVAASFLAKHLLIDWRWGEAYFAKKLLDYDLAANNGGWQWAAGSGCDAAPYFRIFNPYLQTKKFDPELTYVKKWVPEFEEFTYPKPIVEHESARKRCLEVYSEALKQR
jgi:deoxyribodipyrimidine photo-lyase